MGKTRDMARAPGDGDRTGVVDMRPGLLLCLIIGAKSREHTLSMDRMSCLLSDYSIVRSHPAEWNP